MKIDTEILQNRNKLAAKFTLPPPPPLLYCPLHSQIIYDTSFVCESFAHMICAQKNEENLIITVELYGETWNGVNSSHLIDDLSSILITDIL